MIFMLTFFYLLSSISVFAEVPAAPGAIPPYKKASTTLNETYPAAAVIISNTAQTPNAQSDDVPAQFVYEVMTAYNYDELPAIIVPGSEEEFINLEERLQKKLSARGLKKKKIKKLLDSMISIKTSSYLWHQDHFESFVDPKTGHAVLRVVDSYDRYPEKKDMLSILSKNVNKVVMGPPLKKSEGDADSEMGGNIEGLPGGLCLVGNNQEREYSKQFCGHEDNIVNIDVDWLQVGHVDELMKVVPDHSYKGKHPECAFKILAASPKKALELLKNSKYSNENFFSPTKNLTSPKIFFESRAASDLQSIEFICDWLHNNKKSKIPKAIPVDEKTRIIKNFLQQVLMPAYAKMETAIKENALTDIIPEEINTNCSELLASFTNKDLLSYYKDRPEDLEYNNKIQEVMENNKKIVRMKLKERLPQCESTIIDVPNLFVAYGGINPDGSLAPRRGSALNPNPTNSVSLNKTLIFSDPQSSIFREYLTKEMEQIGNKARYLDTWKHSHTGHGNIHCATHVIRYASPAKVVEEKIEGGEE